MIKGVSSERGDSVLLRRKINITEVRWINRNTLDHSHVMMKENKHNRSQIY